MVPCKLSQQKNSFHSWGLCFPLSPESSQSHSQIILHVSYSKSKTNGTVNLIIQKSFFNQKYQVYFYKDKSYTKGMTSKRIILSKLSPWFFGANPSENHNRRHFLFQSLLKGFTSSNPQSKNIKSALCNFKSLFNIITNKNLKISPCLLVQCTF